MYPLLRYWCIIYYSHILLWVLGYTIQIIFPHLFHIFLFFFIFWAIQFPGSYCETYFTFFTRDASKSLVSNVWSWLRYVAILFYKYKQAFFLIFFLGKIIKQLIDLHMGGVHVFLGLRRNIGLKVN